MPVIKRYSNRKLYDTTSRKYVTLEEIAAMIQQGEDVLVMDHVSGHDLTTLTFAQVLLELEKQPGGILPGGVFEKIIQTGQSSLKSYGKTVQSILDPATQINEEITARLDVLLVEKEITEEEHQRWIRLLVTQYPSPADSAEIDSTERICNPE